jgi:hypothetical protein
VASFDEVVPPGKAANLKASVHTTNFKGALTKQVTVQHDDATQGPIVLTVTANVVSSVDVLPFPALQLARRRRGFTTPALLLIRKDPTEKGQLKFSDLKASAPWLTISSRKVTSIEPAVEGLPEALPDDIIISVLATDAAPEGSHVENLTFKTGLPREPESSIPVTVFVQPPLSVQTTELVLSPAPGSTEQATGAVLGAIRDDVDVKTVAVTTDAPAFVARIESSGSQGFRLIVDWSAKGKNTPTNTVVHLKTGNRSVDLPVRVVLPKPETPS